MPYDTNENFDLAVILDNIGGEVDRPVLQQAEAKLMAAVLLDCIAHFQRCQRKNCKLCLSDKMWILSTRVNFLFSFENIANALNVDTIPIRRVFRGEISIPESWKNSLFLYRRLTVIRRRLIQLVK